MVTAIVTTYKREPEIVVRAVKSILNQTYKDLEIIVVDDSPNDYAYRNGVKEQVLLLDDSIQYIQHEKNAGACQARNTGLSMAQGEYVAYLDDDDEWEPSKIQKQVSVFEKGSSEIGLVYCGCIWINQMTKERTIKPLEKHSGHVFDELIKGNFIGGTSCPLMRTSYLKDIGGFDPLMQSAQDADVWLRMASKYKVEFIDEPLFSYYEVHAGEQISTNPHKKLAGVQRLYEKNSQYLQEHSDANWVMLNKISFLYSWTGDLKRGIKTWWKAVRMKPFRIVRNMGFFFRVIQKYYFHIKRTARK